MSYIDAIIDKNNDTIHVVERVDGKRVFKETPHKYTFYYVDPKGKYRSIYDEPLSKITCKTSKDFRKELATYSHKKLYESDLNPLFVHLSENYLNSEPPKLNICFFDIETDMQPFAYPSDYKVKTRTSTFTIWELSQLDNKNIEVLDHINNTWVPAIKSRYLEPGPGYAYPEDPFMPVTSITVYLKWLEQEITLALVPHSLGLEEATKQVEDIPNVYLYESEVELLDTFLSLIEDADVLSAWNGEGFDIPYLVNRVTKVMSREDTKRFCLWGKYPKKREYEKFGKIGITFDLIGRVHLDSLELYRKYTYEERQSYKLDSIGEYEIGENKVPYDGTLDQLYNKDFRKFIEYNRQDTALLNKLDNKLKFIELANAIAHENTVLLPTVLGAVAVSEQAIINEAHSLGLQIPNRRPRKQLAEDDISDQAAGAYVAYPKKGLHDWIGSLDINSLYPSAIRALNMGPETIVGQLRPTETDQYINDQMILKKKSFAAAWEGLFGTFEYEYVMDQRIDKLVTIDWDDGSHIELSGAQAYNLIFDSKRKFTLSANGTIFTYHKEGIIPGLLKRWYSERKDLQKKLKEAIEADDKKLIEYYDKRQLVKKINLNIIYGSLLNASCRFFDQRIGQSTTLTGRQVVKHMSIKVNEIITGIADYKGDAVIYNDTDSIFFSAYKILKSEIDNGSITWNKDTVVQLYDGICEQVNNSFVDFMQHQFHVPPERGIVIKAGREIVGEKALFITKKRYAVWYYDKEGKRCDGKIKAMGLDLKRADTPPFMQEFLMDLLIRVLNGAEEQEILDLISDFRVQFKERPGWEKGTPKRVNNLTKYTKLEEAQGKANLPGHVRASLNWNTLRAMNNDRYSMPIIDGAKVIVCKLRPNPLGFTSVAYPIDELRLPKWFIDLPFDHELMEQTIIDNKLDNLFSVLNWDLESTNQKTLFNTFFKFI